MATCATTRPGCRGLALALLMVAAQALANDDDPAPPRNPDPFEQINRIAFAFNDAGDRWVARPVAQAWEKSTPPPLRRGASNFFGNLRYPVTIVNQFLQGKFAEGGRDVARFVINTTIGLGGLFDPATEIGLRRNNEDFGQTLVVWGVPDGPYLVVPLVGPRTVTHGIGTLADLYVDPLIQWPNSSVSSKAGIVFIVHERSTLLSADRELREAFDPYVFMRDAYLQNRRFRIFDGELPDDDLLLDDLFDDWD